MSFSLVQSAKFVTGGSPESCSFTNPIGNGNMVVVIVGQYNATGDTLTDNKSNTYNLRFSHQAFASSYEFDVYDLLNVTNGPQTVTFTVSSGSGNPIAIVMAEFTPSGSFDQSDSTILTGATSSGAVTGGSVTPTANGELILGFAATTNTGTPALGGGFTTAVSDTGNDNAGLEAILGYQVQSTAASITLTGSGFNQYSPVFTCLLTYKAAATAAALTAALRFVTSARAAPTGKAPLLARGTTEASARATVVNAIKLAARSVANAAGRLAAGRYSLALGATSGALAKGRATPAGAVKVLARGASAASARMSAAGSAALMALHATASSIATGRAALRGTVPLLARGSSDVSSRANATATAGLTARSAARAASRLGAGAYSLALQGVAGGWRLAAQR